MTDPRIPLVLSLECPTCGRGMGAWCATAHPCLARCRLVGLGVADVCDLTEPEVADAPAHRSLAAAMSGADLGRLALEVARSALRLAELSGAPVALVAAHEAAILRVVAAAEAL